MATLPPMPPGNTVSTLGTQINTPLARTFQAAYNGGWCNISVAAPDSSGAAVARCTIEPAELDSFYEALVDTDDPIAVEVHPKPMPGEYLVKIDSDGNCTVTEFLTYNGLVNAYEHAKRAFLADYRPADETMYLVCEACGEACDSIKTANEHECGKTWGTDEERTFKILPESEAM